MVFVGILGASLALLHGSLAVSLRPTFSEVDGILSKYDYKATSNGQCLKFMHIPKTGGTTVDSITLSYPKAERPYRSYMEIVYDKVAEKEAKHTKEGQIPMTAGEIFDSSHSSMYYYVPWMTKHIVTGDYPMWFTPGGPCTTHTPPVKFSQARAYFSDACTNFCVIRDPLQRFLSTYKFDQQVMAHGKCSPEEFDAFTREMKTRFDHHEYYSHLCHFTPQVQMVYGAETKEASTHQFCHRMLRQEHLSEEFDALMKEFGRDDVKMSKTMFTSTVAHDYCNLHTDDIWRSTKDMIYEMYRVDYDAFNYTRA